MDGASSHKRRKNKPLAQSATKEEKKAFLLAQGVELSRIEPYMKRGKGHPAILTAMCDAAAPADFKRYECYRIAEQFGHRVLFLPPYSPELNPIEQVWAFAKNKIAKEGNGNMTTVRNNL